MSKIPLWLIVIAKILLVDLFIVLIVLGWSWVTKDFTLVALSDHFFITGAVAILIGLVASMGSWGHRSDWRQTMAQSAGLANLSERNARMIADLTQTYELVIVFIPAGLIAILIAVILGRSA